MSVLGPEQWQALSPYLDQALALPPSERRIWLASLASTDPTIANHLEILLAEHSDLIKEGFLERSVAQAPFQDRRGRTIGAYKILSAIGEGGMGSVWLAERADGRFQRSVAVKFIRIAVASPADQRRFEREGRILGRLSHPHIAELLDAGVTAEGQPYLVLEHVEGEHIDEYCDEHNLDVEARIRLFLDVLAAMVHAHANLIIHRDLKPSNVLVRNDGQVKLLDFGVAKLLEDEKDAAEATLLTQQAGAALTPAYAAPEQLTGEPVTTATDVYVLGVLLYLLLTGQRPGGSGSLSTAELVRAVLETEPLRMSDLLSSAKMDSAALSAIAEKRATTPDKLRRVLRGDLDTIVAKAIKKNPAERYSSVTAFSDDLWRFLNHEPITARPDTLWYSGAKFVRRNRLALTLTTAAVLLIIGSLFVGLYLTNRERKIAEHRFLQVRQLANKFIELDNDIRMLPGSTKVRSSMVTDSLAYLKSLESEAHIDKDLANEIALAYVRVAHVQGDPTSPNLGQFAEAEASLNKADEFVQSVLRIDPNDRDGIRQAATIAHDRMVLADAQGRQGADIARLADQAVGRLERMSKLPNLDLGEAYALSYFYVNVADANANIRRFSEAIRASQRSLEFSKLTTRANHLQGGIFEVEGIALWQSGDLDGALKDFNQSVEMSAREAASGKVPLRSNLADQLWEQGMFLGKADAEPNLGRPADAMISFQKAMDIAEDLAAKDPADDMSRHEVAEIGLEMGNILRHSNPIKALAVYDHALARSRESKFNARARRDQMKLLAASSYPLRALGRRGEARQRIEMAFQLLRAEKEYPSDKVEPMSSADQLIRAQADDYVENGQMAGALKTYQDLLAKLMASNPDPQNDLRDATCVSRTWTAMASLLRRSGRVNEARSLEDSRAELWEHWERKLPNGEFLMKQSLRQASRAL